MNRLEVLLVEDSWFESTIYQEILEELGCTVTCARDGSLALALMQTKTFDAIVTDYRMRPMNGLELLQVINRRGDAPPTLLHSSDSAIDAHITLADISTVFGCARGHQKDTVDQEATRKYLKEFLDTVRT